MPPERMILGAGAERRLVGISLDKDGASEDTLVPLTVIKKGGSMETHRGNRYL